jgi:hypothetical protein
MPWVLGRAVLGLTVLLAGGQVAVAVVSREPLISPHHLADGFPLVTLACLVGATIGALIVSRYPRHRIGWLLLVGQCGTAFGLAAQSYGRTVLDGDLGPAHVGHLAVWVAQPVDAVFAVTMLAALFLLAPDGRLVSPPWAWALGACVLGVLMHWTATLSVAPSGLDGDGATATSGLAIRLLGGLAFLPILCAVVAGMAAVIVRRHRATGDERQQLGWVSLAAAALAVGVVVAVVAGLVGVPNWVAILPLMAAYLSVPVLTGVAILRFRLYDLDIIVSRAIALTVVSGAVAAGYVAIVVFLGRVVDAPAEGTFWPSLMATALVALGVQPLRRRVLLVADHLVFGRRAAPYVTLMEFSRRLSETPSSGDLLARVAESIGRTLGAERVAIAVTAPSSAAELSIWPASATFTPSPELVVPITDFGERLGTMSIAMPPGGSVRGEEERVLQDFTAQLGRAVRTMRLESELADHVGELAAQAEEMAASGSRLRIAQAAGRLRFEGAVSQEVLPHLARLPEQLRSAAAEPAHASADIMSMIESTHLALTSLRRLTRGVFPAQLGQRGLAAALSSQLSLTGLGKILHIEDDEAAQRFVPRFETALYFCGIEFLRELRPPEEVTLSGRHGWLTLRISGRGANGIAARTRHRADRVAALGGDAEITIRDRTATLSVRVPVPGPGESADSEDAGPRCYP